MRVILKIIQIQTKPMANTYYNTKLMQSKIQSKYLKKDLDKAANLGINQNKAKINQDT